MIAVVVGTRPEAIKMAPVVMALRDAGMDADIVGVRQHVALAGAALAEFGLAAEQWCGRPPAEGLARFMGDAVPAVAHALREMAPDLVLVQGDTATALAGTLAAHAEHVPVGHVEAGLRTADPWEPWPEEWNRRLIDHGSQLWFAPTQSALADLRAEGLSGQVTGNTGIDALLWMRGQGDEGPGLFDAPGILVSLHRREAWGARLEGAVGAVAELADEYPVVFLHHPSPAVAEAAVPLRDHPNVRFCEPQSYRETVRALAECRLVVTDSGGLQEEAPALGKPVLVVRNTTERPEVLKCGLGSLVGYDPRTIVESARVWLTQDREFEPKFPFGDGRAAGRIARRVGKFVEEGR